MRTAADFAFTNLLADLLADRNPVETRNHDCMRTFARTWTFDSFPLVTVRPVAVKKALHELEWFLTGDAECPEHLLDWWRGQLNPSGEYLGGYGQQLRAFAGLKPDYSVEFFDQIEQLIEGLRRHPYSRRHVITTWNPSDMARITEVNQNRATPTTCHMSLVQFQVSPCDGGKGKGHRLDMLTVQRSADTLLGLPHNWVQAWALLKWLAHRADCVPGSMTWIGGDVHLYDHPTHVQCAREIVGSQWWYDCSNGGTHIASPSLLYTPSSSQFKAADFDVVRYSANDPPLTDIRPELL
jgi:thymidylate synthase